MIRRFLFSVFKRSVRFYDDAWHIQKRTYHSSFETNAKEIVQSIYLFIDLQVGTPHEVVSLLVLKQKTNSSKNECYRQGRLCQFHSFLPFHMLLRPHFVPHKMDQPLFNLCSSLCNNTDHFLETSLVNKGITSTMTIYIYVLCTAYADNQYHDHLHVCVMYSVC